MKRNYNTRKIKSKRSYSAEEIAEVLEIHVQTVRCWHKEGLQPLDKKSTPYLFLGSEIIQYIADQKCKRRTKLKEGEFYCLGCKKAVSPTKMTTEERDVVIGKNTQSLLLKAECPICKKSINRFSSDRIEVKLPKIVKKKPEHPKEPDLFDLIKET